MNMFDNFSADFLRVEFRSILAFRLTVTHRSESLMEVLQREVEEYSWGLIFDLNARLRLTEVPSAGWEGHSPS